jgi:glutamine synthetase
MAKIRFSALEQVEKRQPIAVEPPAKKISDYYGVNVFSKTTMQAYLSGEVYKKVVQAIEKGEKIDDQTADAVAGAMKNWAVEQGATHYTHWFQPLTGATAEKHDAFFDYAGEGRVIEKFKGSALVQQEPDASSFPNGGIRNTFEARGYTAWDPTSPAFLIETGGGKTLCIPTVFIAYTGEALDYKTPLLKALDRVDKAATAVCQLFDREITSVKASLGIEQEFFLIDKAWYHARPDLIMAERSLFGHSPAKGQQLEDHYFGSIPPRVQCFMQEFEIEALKLGIPVHTRHNEVAPGQFECAPIFEDANLAIDHNQLLMDVMEKVADKHNFKVLFHEKPFAGVNGSGKHNNWSLITNTGKNLLAPTSKAKENLLFLSFLINTVKAVYDNADLLRASIASAANDFRLGANEAPPAIMSVFLGQQLSAVLDELESNATIAIDKGDNMYIKLGIDKIPPILMDNTDRNRTSPFAFTGNKFEFRAVGSSANCASANIVLNTIMADQLRQFHAEVEKRSNADKDAKREVIIVEILREYIKASKAIRFEGNGYSDEWKQEAAKRGLSNLPTTPRALDAYLSDKSKRVFTENNIFTLVELEARHDIMLHGYTLKVQIESRSMESIVLNQIIPSTLTYLQKLIENAKGLKDLGLIAESDSIVDMIKSISHHIKQIKDNTYKMVDARKEANALSDTHSTALAYCEKVKPYFDTIRYHVDKLEMVVDDELWALPKYREMLFLK